VRTARKTSPPLLPGYFDEQSSDSDLDDDDEEELEEEDRDWIKVDLKAKAEKTEKKEVKLKEDETKTASSSTSSANLLEENQKLMDDRLCKICVDREANIVFIPCGHLATCGECAAAFKQCPVCRTKIRQAVKTYMC
jgi:hypothetical protein